MATGNGPLVFLMGVTGQTGRVQIPDQVRFSGGVLVLRRDAARGRFAASLAGRSLSFRSLPTGLEKPARHEVPR